MQEEVTKKFGGVDILVNNAGIVRDKSFVKMTSDMWKVLARIPLGRLGKASEVAGTVSFLASRDGDYIKGQVFDINGGLYI